MLKKLIRRIVLGYRCSSETYVSYLKEKGCKIGDKVIVYSPNTTVIDESRPVLLEIGNSVRITAGVVILTHDFSYSVCRPIYHDLINDSSERTIIGNNVFIGMNAVILPGTVIGNNCIVGAGSVVRGRFESNVVIAGNPAKVICTLDEYYNRRKKARVEEAFALANLIRDTYNREPFVKEMGNYYWLYAPRNEEWLHDNNIDISMSGDDSHQILHDFLNSSPIFNGYEEFLKASRDKN